jgi:smad nuclear-interacting protein 1
MPTRSPRSPSYRSSRRDDRSYDERPRDNGYDRRRDYPQGGSSRRDYDRDYTERDRERERERDRERYTSRNERRRSRSRSRRRSSRSASPIDKNKGKPNFANSGLLAAETNKVKAADGTSTILKYNEPPEARKPQLGWRVYVFKGDDQPGAYLPYISVRAQIKLSARNVSHTQAKRLPPWSRPTCGRYSFRTSLLFQATRRFPT